MAFGPIMQLTVDELSIELAPIDKESVAAFASPGLQQASISRYLSMGSAPTIEDEQEWYEKVRKERDSQVWGIWVNSKGKKVLVGTTSLNGIRRDHVHIATSGSLISDRSYWGKGIASHIHKARTWYAFKHLGLHCVRSEVLHGNIGSAKALGRSGYEVTHVERNAKFVEGSLRHADHLECVNPNDPFWVQWWRGDRPPKKFVEARRRTADALVWAEQNITLL